MEDHILVEGRRAFPSLPTLEAAAGVLPHFQLQAALAVLE